MDAKELLTLLKKAIKLDKDIIIDLSVDDEGNQFGKLYFFEVAYGLDGKRHLILFPHYDRKEWGEMYTDD